MQFTVAPMFCNGLDHRWFLVNLLPTLQACYSYTLLSALIFLTNLLKSPKGLAEWESQTTGMGGGYRWRLKKKIYLPVNDAEWLCLAMKHLE
jgi:hypothetical protein